MQVAHRSSLIKNLTLFMHLIGLSSIGIRLDLSLNDTCNSLRDPIKLICLAKVMLPASELIMLS